MTVNDAVLPICRSTVLPPLLLLLLRLLATRNRVSDLDDDSGREKELTNDAESMPLMMKEARINDGFDTLIDGNLMWRGGRVFYGGGSGWEGSGGGGSGRV